jgi:hypothetical protein
MKEFYFSIRTVIATSQADAIKKIETERFNESHELSDKVLTESELRRILNGQKPQQNYVVEVTNTVNGGLQKPLLKDSLLATDIFKGKVLICVYSRGEAVKKARMFGGKAKLFKEKIDKKKHYII